MEAEDDLEYDITFPTLAGAGNDTEKSDDEQDEGLLDDFVVTGETKEPVVILIGWAGCKDQYLAKYSKIYEQQSCITIRYIPPQEMVFYKPHLVNSLATKLLELLCDYCLEDNPIFFHIFSNNGCFFYAEITRLLHSAEGKKFSNLQVKGILVDSGPGRRRITKAAKAFAFSAGVTGLMKYIYFLGMCFYLLFLKFYLMFAMRFMKISKEFTVDPFSVFESIKDDKSRCPQLFLYSKADSLIPYTDIEDVIRHRRNVLNVEVDSIRYETAEHVALLRDNAETYALKCRNFISDCLKSDEASFGE